MSPELLSKIIAASAATAVANPPYGYCFQPEDVMAQLHDLKVGGMIDMGTAGENGIPVRPTQAAIAWNAEAAAQAHHVAQQPAPAPEMQTASQVPQHAHVTIEDGVPMPDAKRAGFGPREGGTMIDHYGFATLRVSQSFFVPQSVSTDPTKPVHRTFSSVVSQANKKLYPRDFAIREVDETAQGRGKGARIWRLPDLTGPRPTRPRKAKPDAASTPAPGPSPAFLPMGTAVVPHSAPPAPFTPPPGSFSPPGWTAPQPGTPGPLPTFADEPSFE